MIFLIRLNNYCFEASRSLDVYEIIQEVLHTTSNPGNRSQAVVKILFKRRVEYHIGHTFLEVLVIKCLHSKNSKSFNNFFAGDLFFYSIFLADFPNGHYWIFILLLWNWKNLRQSYCCIDNNPHFFNCVFIYTGCKHFKHI